MNKPLILLFAVVLLAANLRSPLVAVGPITELLRTQLQLSGSLMGAVAALPMLMFALFSPMAAGLARRWGIENVLIISMVALIGGLLLRIAVPSATFLLLGTAVIAMSIALGNVLLPALAKRNLPTKIGLVVGVMSATMSISSSIAAAISVPLAQWGGWQWSLGIWLLTTLLALIVWWCIRHQFIAPALPDHNTELDWNAWHSPAAWIISIYMGFQSLVFYAIVNFLPAVLMEKGLTAVQAGSYLAVFQATSLLGVLTVMFWFEKVKQRQVFNVILTILMFVGILGIWLAPTSWVGVWVTCLGIGGSGVFSVVMMLFALRTEHAQQAAMVSGMAQTVGYFIAIFGPLGMGILYDWTQSWMPSMAILSGLMAIECVLAWFVASPKSLISK